MDCSTCVPAGIKQSTASGLSQATKIDESINGIEQKSSRNKNLKVSGVLIV
jgi:hypothetical protein